MSKRADGEGSIYRGKDGRWRSVVSMPGGKRQYLSGKTQKEVEGKLTATRRLVSDGLPLASGRATVAEFMGEWLEGREGSLRPLTLLRYQGLIRRHVLPDIGHVRLARLQPQNLQKLYRAKLAAGLSSTTVHHLHTVLHGALRQAVRWGLVARNVADLVDPPRIARKEMSFLNTEQAGALIAAASGDRLEALFVLAVTAGLRQGELLALRWHDVDLERGVLAVTGTAQRVNGRFVISEPKSERSRRQVILSRRAVEAMTRHRAAQAAERLEAEEWADLDLVFANTKGRFIESQNLNYRYFHPLLERAGLPWIRFHDLRHTAASLMLVRGVHPRVVADMLGHANASLVLERYSHVTDAMHRDAARAIDDLFPTAR